MNERSFSLQPFPGGEHIPEIRIAGRMVRRPNTLDVRYELIGRLHEVVIPMTAEMPTRMKELWEETCFEFFLAVKGSPGY